MSRPELGTSAFSLLDLVAYLFPGAIFLFGLVLIQPDLLSLAADSAFQSASLFIVSSYTAGFLGVATFWLVLFPFVIRISGRRLEAVVESSRRFGLHLSPAFHKALDAELVRVWGDELFAAGKRDLVFLCWECVQSEGHPSCIYIKRLTTLFNMAGSLVVAIPVLATGLVAQDQMVLAVLAIPAWIVSWGAFFAFRRQFAEKVMRLFFVLTRMGKFNELIATKLDEAQTQNPPLQQADGSAARR